MVSFLNDYNSLGSKEIIEHLNKYAYENNIGYGFDKHSDNAKKLIKNELKNNNVDIHFLVGGTQTNKVGLFQMLKPYQAVICVETGHINVHETGAVESTGHKIITVKGENGKVTAKEVKDIVNSFTDLHMVMPKCVYISDSTEIGTIYSLSELKAISKVCKENDLYLFLDGARLGCALEAENNDITISDLPKYCDMFYIGGTKNGAPIGEALVIVNDDLKKNFSYLVKNQGALLAKGFLCGLIFEKFFENGLYYRNAKNSVDMASNLRKVFKNHNIKEEYVNPTNQVFVKITNSMYDFLITKCYFEIWENSKDYKIVRFVANCSTTIEDIKAIDNLLSDYLKNSD